ncbi:UNVERIFIED_CONTAM: hypothetical protein HDU68_006106 [Siphonaria sp. JEL0065]|nr:hypothetical protein HDU68_006106 [Siphonaria sp. JEL0065]
MIRLESELETIKEAQKNEIALLDDEIKAIDKFNKDLEFYKKEDSKAMTTARSNEWMDEFWRGIVQDCTSFTHIVTTLKETAKSFPEHDLWATLRTLKERINQRKYEDPEPLFEDGKRLWEQTKMVHSDKPESDFVYRDVNSVIKRKFRNVIADIVCNNSEYDYIWRDLGTELEHDRSSEISVPEMYKKYISTLSTNSDASSGVIVSAISASFTTQAYKRLASTSGVVRIGF